MMIYTLRTHLSLYHLKTQRSAKKKKKSFPALCCHSLTCWLVPPIKEPFMTVSPGTHGVLCQKEPHKPFILEFSITEGHINNSKS